MKEISLDISLREYQKAMFDAIENKGYKRGIFVWPRRAGKDFCAFFLTVRQAVKKAGYYLLVYPSYSQGRKILFDSKMNDGRSFMDLIPPCLVHSVNNVEMKIRLVNGSVIAVVGSEKPSALVGVNLFGAVFSEYAIANPNCYKLLRPSLTQTNGWAIFISTPRGKNSLWDLLTIARENSNEWYQEVLTINDTQHIPISLIQQELDSGELSKELIDQEYYCSFAGEQEGSFYAYSLDKMRREDRITTIPYDPSLGPVHTAWDLGVFDATCIVMWQNAGAGKVHIIDCYSNMDKGLEHYIKHLSTLPYIFGYHWAPHDIAVREFGTGMSRIEQAKHMGLSFRLAPHVSIEDGIESLRSNLQSRVYIDQNRCKDLIKALEAYRRTWDPILKRHRDTPVHDWASNYADAARYASLCFNKFANNTSAEELDRRFKASQYGEGHNPNHWMFEDPYKRY